MIKRILIGLIISNLICSTVLAEEIVRIKKPKGLATNPVPSKIDDSKHSKFDNVYIDDDNIEIIKGRQRLNTTAHTDATVNGFWYYDSTQGTSSNAASSLLLHMNGADTSTTFTDSSISSHTVTANGDAQIDTAESKFGGASGLFDGTGDYLSAPDSSDWDFGSGNFTIDFWVRFNAISGSVESTIYSNGNSAANDGTMNIYVFSNQLGVRVFVQNLYTWAPSLATWYHVAVTRAGTTVRAFVDGSSLTLASDGGVGAKTISNTEGIQIAQRMGGSGNFNGWLDEFRIIKDSAEFTEPFNVPTAEYSEENTSIRKLVIAEMDDLVTYDLDGSNRTVIASSLTDEKWDSVQIGSIMYLTSSTNGLYKWGGTGSATAITGVSTPASLTFTASTSAGGMTPGVDAQAVCNGTGTSNTQSAATSSVYSYRVVEYNNQAGIESEPSTITTVSLTGDNTVTCNCDTGLGGCVTSGKQTSTTATISASNSSPFNTFRFYRSVANGKYFYRVAEQASGTITDGTPDLALGELLDTTINTISPPSFRYIEEYKGVIFVAEGNTIKFAHVPALLINNADKYWLDTDEIKVTGLITGMVKAGDSLIVFTNSSIYQIVGFGANSFRLIPAVIGVGSVSDETIELDSNGDAIFNSGTAGVYKLRVGRQPTDNLNGNIIDSTNAILTRLSSPDLDDVFAGINNQIDLDPIDYATSHAYYDTDNDLYHLFINDHEFIYDNRNSTWSHIPASKMLASLYRRNPSESGQGVLVDNLGFIYNNWLGYSMGVSSGTVTGTPTSSTSTTLTDTTATFNTTGDGLKGAWIAVVPSNFGTIQYRQISSNTATVITINSNWTTNPTTSYTYYVGYIIPNWFTKQYELGDSPSEFEALALTLVHEKSASTQTLYIDAFREKSTTSYLSELSTIDLSQEYIDKRGVGNRAIWLQWGFRTYVYNTSTTVVPPVEIIGYAIHAVAKEKE